MSDLQTAILEATRPLVKTFSWLKVAFSTVLYTASISLVVYFSLLGTLDWLVVVVIFVASFGYLFLRETRLAKLSAKIMEAQRAYVMTKFENATLYIPMLDRVASNVVLRRAALFITENGLFLEAFSQQNYSYVPKQSITVPYGKDFQIIDLSADAQKGYMVYHAKLLGSDYLFYTCIHAGLTELIQSFIDAPQGDH